MAAPLTGSLLGVLFVLGSGISDACTLKLGPRSGTYARPPAGAATSDTMAPTPAYLSEVVTLLVSDPEESDGVDCADVDELTFRVDGSDDTTPPEDLYLAAFIAPSQADVFLNPTPTTYLKYDPGAAASRTVTIALGEAKHRARDNAPFRSQTEFCFAIALVDAAGNMGARSEAQCLNTTYPYDRTVRFVEKHPGGCSSSAGLAAWLALGTASALRRRRSNARPSGSRPTGTG